LARKVLGVAAGEALGCRHLVLVIRAVLLVEAAGGLEEGWLLLELWLEWLGLKFQ